jgi:hypothetical protein
LRVGTFYTRPHRGPVAGAIVHLLVVGSMLPLGCAAILVLGVA